MNSTERKPFKLNVIYKREQSVVVYAESFEDALDIARDAAVDGELIDVAPEESMSGGVEPMAEITVDGGYSEGGPVKIMVGAMLEDAPHVRGASHG